MRVGRMVLVASWLICSVAALGGETGKFQATDQPLNLRGASGELAEWLKGFDHPVETFGYVVTPLSEESDFRVLQVTFPSPMDTPFPENKNVPGELYVPKKPALGADGRMPGAVVLDILDGRAILPRMTARVLASRGVAAFYFPMPYYNARRPPGNAHFKLLEEDPRQYLTPPMRQVVMDVRRAKAILASRPEIDPKRIGVTGISLGGIMTSLSAGVDGEFYRVAPVLAGGDLATLIFHAREMRDLRKVLESHGVDRDAAAKLLAPVEPLNFATRIDPKTCLMINAGQDEVIPKTATMDLWKAFGNPTLLWMPTGHYSCVLFLPNAQQKVADFLLGMDVKTLELGAQADARGSSRAAGVGASR
jgi:dienelactone hydrolase